jgi:hypothetical protein
MGDSLVPFLLDRWDGGVVVHLVTIVQLIVREDSKIDAIKNCIAMIRRVLAK